MSGNRIYGLREAQAALKDLGRPEVLRSASEAAAKLIVTAAQGRARTRLERRAAKTLVALRGARPAVRLGGGFAGALGAEFGAVHNSPRRVNHFGNYHGWNQFEGWKGSGSDAGYFLWPAIRSEMPAILELYADELERQFNSEQ
jgi:hypothetical protein